MENSDYNNVIVGTNQFIINAIVTAINLETEKNKRLTEYFLNEYFRKSDKEYAAYYYDGRGNREYYNLISEKNNKFNTDVCNLARKHKRLHIGTIDNRTDEMKLFTYKNFGYFMEDVDFNIFDFLNNLITLKYLGDDENSKLSMPLPGN